MKNRLTALIVLAIAIAANAFAASAQTETVSVSDPEGITTVTVGTDNGKAWYSISHGEKLNLPASRLGLMTNAFDWTSVELKGMEKEEVSIDYTMNRTKASKVSHRASKGTVTFENPKGEKLYVEFVVSRNDVAFRYRLPKEGETGSVRVMDELTEFNFPEGDDVVSYLTPQSDAMIGWKRTKPSYEEYYGVAKPLSEKSQYGHGYTFPCLFKVGENGWVLVSETGVDGSYCGSRLSDSRFDQNKGTYSYKLEYPMPEENNGNGTSEPGIALPGTTPWRTVTLGADLAPIVETTVAWDVVEPLYETANDYKFGKGTWSWIVWQDGSIRMEDQKKYVDLASAMGFNYTLVDNWWDKTIGHDAIPELVDYARERNVELFLWYSSSGWWNDIEQSPVHIMSNPILRKKEMKWLRDNGIKGIKVDFFGGDKQETLALYEAILSDADDHGLMVIFHGCTLPRGWEKMYPNYVGSEAVRASENLVFMQEECDMEAVAASLHPFIRNTVGCMEFGGCFLNERLDKTNSRGTVRRTTDVFQLATCVLFQNPIQNFAITPNNLTDAPEVCLDFLREVPTTWDETRYIDGVPGEYVVLARRNGDKWYVAAINALEKTVEFKVKDVLAALGLEKAEVRLIDGGNTPEECMAKPGHKITVPQNDGAVMIIG